MVTPESKFPVQIGNPKCFIKAEIIQEKIPLLLSKTSLEKAGTVLDLQNDSMKTFNEDMEVTTSNIGHYAINILPNDTCNFDNIKQVLIFEEDESGKSKIQKITKLHKQFGHDFFNKFRKFIKTSWYTIIKY